MVHRKLNSQLLFSGIGIVSPLGIGKTAFSENLLGGRSGIAPVSVYNTEGLHSSLGGEVVDYDASAILGKKGLRLLSRSTLFVLGAMQLALEDAGLAGTPLDDGSCGVVLASAGSMETRCGFYVDAYKRGPRSLNPALFPETMVNAPASRAAIRFGITGPNATISTGMTAGLDALRCAADLIISGQAERVLWGGVLELSRYLFMTGYVAGQLSRSDRTGGERSAPWDRQRNGFILGEGAAVLLLERADLARARSAPCYGSYGGGAACCLPCEHDQEGAAVDAATTAIRHSLTLSEAAPSPPDWVEAGANGSPLGDRCLSRALNQVLPGIQATSSKGQTGESLTASGVFQVAAALLSMQAGQMPPTLGCREQDSCCPVPVGGDRAHALAARQVLVTSVTPRAQAAAAVVQAPPG